MSHKNIQPSNFRQLRGFLNTRRDYYVATKEKLLEILYFKLFYKYINFTSEGGKIRNKVLKDHYRVSVWST